jgi:hypothetical protein
MFGSVVFVIVAFDMSEARHRPERVSILISSL